MRYKPRMSGEAHIRIDEGIKRGPRKPHKERNSIKARDIAGRVAPTIPIDLDPATVLQRYLTDERTQDIAASYNVTRPALNYWILEKAEESWRKAQIARAISRKEKAEDELEVADHPLTLARAREVLRGAQWELERLFSRLFGQKQELNVTVNSDLGNRLRRARERVIEGEVTHVATAQAALQHDDESDTPA